MVLIGWILVGLAAPLAFVIIATLAAGAAAIEEIKKEK